MTNIKKTSIYKTVLWFIFVVYISVLIKLVLFKDGIINVGVSPFDSHINVIPFKSTVEILRFLSPVRVIENILGNILIFVPFGMILPLVTKARKSVILYGALFSFTVEIIQYCFLLGFTDIDDLIYNTFGTLVGYLLFLIISSKSKTELTSLRISALLLCISGFSGILLLAYMGLLF